MSVEIGADYSSSLADLTVNSKPLINMLTILAEENQEHAGVIVSAIEAHLEKVRPEIKLPVLYLVDSIIKNVGGAYTQKFSQSIVNMFTSTFKQVDEKTRSQMFKLRETWNEVFPANKLRLLDARVNLVDPAWPIQAAAAPVIHLNPHFQKKGTVAAPAAAAGVSGGAGADKTEILNELARKQQELLLLQRKKIEMQLAATRRQLAQTNMQGLDAAAEQVPPAMPTLVPTEDVPQAKLPVQARLGPPVLTRAAAAGGGGARITPVSGAMLAGATRRADPRLTRRHHAQPPHPPAPALLHTQPPVSPDVFDIKPLERSDRVTKRKNAITIDVRPELAGKVRDPRARRDQRDPRLDKKRTRDTERRLEEEPLDQHSESKVHSKKPLRSSPKSVQVTFPVVDPKKIYKLSPIPKIPKLKPADNLPVKSCDDVAEAASPSKRKKEAPSSPRVQKKLRKRENKDSTSSSSPEKSTKNGPKDNKPKPNETIPPAPTEMDTAPEAIEKGAEDKNLQSMSDDEAVAFKEVKNSTRERNYMRRNREKSESPERTVESPASPVNTSDAPPPPESQAEATTVPDVLMDENKDVDLRVLPGAAATAPAEPAAVARKRPSTEAESKPSKKNKTDKFDILFGNEDVDLRTLPQMEEAALANESSPAPEDPADSPGSPPPSPPKQKSWAKVKVPNAKSPEEKNNLSQLDLVRAKFAEVTKGKDRLGRPLLYNKDDPVGRRRTISSSEDTDMRYMDTENDRETISQIMSQVQEQVNGGNLNPEQINQLVMQVFQLNERQKLKEAKQRESLEASKRKLLNLSKLSSDDETDVPKKASPSHIAVSTFGDIDERIVPPRNRSHRDPIDQSLHKAPPIQPGGPMDCDLRVPPIGQFPDDSAPNGPYPPRPGALPMPPGFRGGFQPIWNRPPPREEFNGPRGMRNLGPAPFFRNPRMAGRQRPPYGARMAMPPPPVLGMSQGECPLAPYVRSTSPPPLGTVDLEIPPTNFALVEYIERDPMKTIDIDGVPREIRFYGRTAIVMLDWDDPREIKFLPGRRRITLDGKDSFALNFNEDDLKVNVNGDLLKLGYGRPTRELYVEDMWYECFFGGPPVGIIVKGKVMLVHLAGPPPQVDIGKEKRTDIVAGKINVIVDATTMCPVFLDAKPQKFEIDGQVLTIRFADSLQTVLINEKAFKVEYGGLPKPIIVNNHKHFIRFSVLPRNVRPGQVTIAHMDGRQPKSLAALQFPTSASPMELDNPIQSVDNNLELNAEADNSNQGGLDMLASLMPSSMAPASQFSGYSVAEPLQASDARAGHIPGLDAPADADPPALPFFGSINVNDLFAKLVATGIVNQAAPTAAATTAAVPAPAAATDGSESKRTSPDKPKESKAIKRVDLMRPETLRVKQAGVVSQLYSGMQCSGCGARFPPEQTVRYSQHLDWHFRQNRRERDSARRAHSRNWHYDLSDWIQYEEIEDLEEREKSWFESQGGAESGAEGAAGAGGAAEGAAAAAAAEHEALSVAAGAPADAACALCGDKFDQFYNQDKEEWHLRRAVRHNDNNYHPLCFDDYKAAQAKAEAPADDSVVEVVSAEKASDAEAGAAGGEGDGPDVEEVLASDSESVVEVLETESQSELSQDGEKTDAIEVLEETVLVGEVEEEEEEDDVVLKAEPVVQVDVEDDADTDDETTCARAERDKLFHLANVRIKQEPIDPDDEPVVTAESQPAAPVADTTHAAVTSTIDGNLALGDAAPAPALPAGGIRINITSHHTPAAAAAPASPPSEPLSLAGDDYGDEPLPPGEEPEMQYSLKPSLEGVQFGRQPPVQRGIELSGLCSIM